MHRLFRPEVLRAFDNLVGQLSQGPAVIGGHFKSLRACSVAPFLLVVLVIYSV
ncbi:hypothetical protein HBH69_238790 [Parastagonospora nodorum]|nr:hypothetical protein HBH52_250900 [Parastagonospora nodorum]KAH4009562.1 hypothetical protein HBI09_235260 [Parastagonospora nodorum]KAH4077123.1 hypothetical protein HBH46_243660 [Parastagonospora nodorum]KAH4952474.1 hypothetical protein HBI78_241450 [Parastagonospora nodorum]KAH4969133.1 hypothetical protein HBI77_242470 [Parastagonospora nodorum]